MALHAFRFFTASYASPAFSAWLYRPELFLTRPWKQKVRVGWAAEKSRCSRGVSADFALEESASEAGSSNNPASTSHGGGLGVPIPGQSTMTCAGPQKGST
jgi:hypothetical protein